MPPHNVDRDRSGSSKPGKPPQQPQRSGMFGWLLALVIGALALLAIQAGAPRPQTMTWSEFVARYHDGSVEQGSIEYHAAREEVQAVVREMGRPVRVRVSIQGQTETYIPELKALTGGDYKTVSPSPFWQFIFSPYIVTLVVLLVIWLLLLRGLRSMSAGSGMLGAFGKSRHRILAKASTGVTFKDVAGVEEAKEELVEIVEFLKNPKKFTRLGGRIPRGVLLAGPPGCGKTLLAKAIAGEADVPFFSISGSDFVEMFVGVGASRVRDLFKQAKENAPCIIFLDEIDAVGRKRGSGFTTGGHDEREQTLNAILVEMDGFESSDQVIVIAATNREDVLDPALTRPGRFDRRVVVPLPDLKGRLEILQVHARKVKMSPDVDLERIARGTPGFSGADLAAIINEAAIMATMAEKEAIEQVDLEEARDKVRFGRQRKSRHIEEEERVATAYHEAGHAVLQVLLPDTDPLHKVTIIPRGEYGGASMSLPEKDRYGYGLRWLKATMRVLCGGRIAELKKTGDVSSGAAADIQQVTRMARTMVLEWGMSERLGFLRFGPEPDREGLFAEREYSEETARIIDEEIKRFADEAYSDARRLIEEHWDKVVRVAEALLQHETLTAEEVQRLLEGRTLSKPSVADLLAREAAARKAASASPSAAATPSEDEDPGPIAAPQPA